jgi:hypothetical protein
MAGLTAAREDVAREVERAIPPDDPLRPLVDSFGRWAAAVEAAEVRISTDASDRLARAAVYGVQRHIAVLVRAEVRKLVGWIVLAIAVGAAGGWMVGRG